MSTLVEVVKHVVMICLKKAVIRLSRYSLPHLEWSMIGVVKHLMIGMIMISHIRNPIGVLTP